MDWTARDQLPWLYRLISCGKTYKCEREMGFYLCVSTSRTFLEKLKREKYGSGMWEELKGLNYAMKKQVVTHYSLIGNTRADKSALKGTM